MRGSVRSFCSRQMRSRSSMVRTLWCSIEQGDALGAEPLDLQQLERGSRIFREHLVATVEGAALADFDEHAGDSFADSGDFGDFAIRVAEYVGNPLGMAFDDGGALR